MLELDGRAGSVGKGGRGEDGGIPSVSAANSSAVICLLSLLGCDGWTDAELGIGVLCAEVGTWSCLKGSPLSNETLVLLFGGRSNERPTDRGRLAARRLNLSVRSSRGEFRIRRNSVAASNPSLDGLRLPTAELLLMPSAALTILGMRFVLDAPGFARLHDNELPRLKIREGDSGLCRRFGVDRLLVETAGDTERIAASSPASPAGTKVCLTCKCACPWVDDTALACVYEWREYESSGIGSGEI